MNRTYLTVKEQGLHELEVKKSRFICFLARVNNEEEAKAIIQTIKKEHWKASHNCSAYLIGERNEIQRSSDDGEPAGTAGLPMLEILKKRELINTLAVVTRYFGGTELGKGGLIRAYGGVVNEALSVIGIVQGKPQQEVKITVAYSLHGKLETFLANSNFTLVSTAFTDVVTVTCMIDEHLVKTFTEEITNILSGQGMIVLGELAYFENDYVLE